jgi:hypothetical protein
MRPQGLCKVVLVFLFVGEQTVHLLEVPTEIRGLLEVRQLLQCTSALRPHYCSCPDHTLVIRIIEWFDMVLSIADQASSADVCASCGGS